MLSGPGRPSKACNTCKVQKAGCSGDRPICARCWRLRKTCQYEREAARPRKLRPSPFSVQGGSGAQASLPTNLPQSSSIAGPEENHLNNNDTTRIGNYSSSYLPRLLASSVEERYHGIPLSLALELVEVYFVHVGNASLLLHKRSFIEELSAGVASPHVVISCCAVAANFYRDKNNGAVFKEHGFMTEWAERAGKLVFQEVEDVNENNLVTFWNLAFFWHSQGSWRRAYIHRGCGAQAAHILGLGVEPVGMKDSWALEIRRRRFWAAYLMHCYASEPFPQPEPGGNIQELTLPWPQEDFDIGISRSPRVSLASGQSNGGIFGEFVKAWTLWSSVNSLIKTLESNNSRVTAIHLLDDQISDWWSKLPASLQLTPSTMAQISPDLLPNILHLHIIYHQCLCALHSSIVPLFCWGAGDDSRSSARQLSAQIAFENACEASALLDAFLSVSSTPETVPSFVAYAAFCGCAIQIPFMWCSKQSVQKRAHENVRANIKMIQALAKYWKFCSLLESRIQSLLKIYGKNPLVIEDEPRYIEPRILSSFKINAPSARDAILGHIHTLWTKDTGLQNAGDENADIRVEEEPETQTAVPESNNQTALSLTNLAESSNQNQVRSPPESLPSLSLVPEEDQFQQPSTAMLSEQYSGNFSSLPMIDPWCDPVMLDMFPSNEDFSYLEIDFRGPLDSQWLERGA